MGIFIIFFSLFVERFSHSHILENVRMAQNGILVVGFCLLFLVLGIARLQISEFRIANDTLSKYNDTPEKITLVGQIAGEPDVRDASQKLKIAIDHSESAVLVTVARYPEYHYLGTITVTGKLKTPGEFQGFNYKNYLLKDGIYSVMDNPKVELVSHQHHYNVFSFL